MQFRNFTWPNEPSSLRVTSRRRTALLEEPGGGWTLQDLGTAARTVTGEGVFFGETAYESLRTLEALLAQGGAGALTLPHVGTLQAVLTELEGEHLLPVECLTINWGSYSNRIIGRFFSLLPSFCSMRFF